MAFNIVRSSPDSLAYDAFYIDEFGIVNASTNINDPTNIARIGVHKNRFTLFAVSAGNVQESPKSTSELSLQNQANPYWNLSVTAPYKQTQIPPKPYEDRHQVGMFFSDSTIAAVAKDEAITINVTILYAVGTEMNRHGLRSFFEKASAYQALILVPGTEPPRDPDRWGIAISDGQIRQLIRKQFTKDVPYKVTVLAAFSTGGCGLHQTFLHNLINVDKVQRVIYFDCLYENQCKATPASSAIKNLKSRATNAKIIVYKTSEGGNDYVKDQCSGA